MPVLPSSLTDPLWNQFQALLPEREAAAHRLGCHRPRIPDRVVFDKLLVRLVLKAPTDSTPTTPARQPR